MARPSRVTYLVGAAISWEVSELDDAQRYSARASPHSVMIPTMLKPCETRFLDMRASMHTQDTIVPMIYCLLA